MFQGLRTIVYHVTELGRATEWYTALLGFGPYYDTPYYVGYNVGGYELGLHPAETSPAAPTPAIAVTYWGVDDIEAAHARLIKLGATARFEVTEVGEGIKLADVIDPFGNIIGIIYNPHFKLP